MEKRSIGFINTMKIQAKDAEIYNRKKEREKESGSERNVDRKKDIKKDRKKRRNEERRKQRKKERKKKLTWNRMEGMKERVRIDKWGKMTIE